VIMFGLGIGLLSGKAQTEPPNAVFPKTSLKSDRRYAIVQGPWSAATISLFSTWSAFDDNPGRRASFYSPDHKKIIEVSGEKASVNVGGRTFDTGIDNLTKHDAELSWAPDSTKFFVNWTETSEGGTWHAQVYAVDVNGLHEFPNVEETARSDFEQRVRKMPMDQKLKTPKLQSLWDSAVYCEPYNVIGGRWLNGSKEILLSVLVPNTSACRYMAEFNVYRVNATTGKILRRYTAEEAHEHFGDNYLPKIVGQW
jgi:hypothetical protein